MILPLGFLLALFGAEQFERDGAPEAARPAAAAAVAAVVAGRGPAIIRARSNA
jgi:hypothetical protein